jgi:hypothetical protein
MGKTEVAPAEARTGGAQTSHFVKAESRPFTGHMLDLPKGGISDAAIQ